MRQLLHRAGVETVRLTGTREELAVLPGAAPLGAVASLDLSGNQLDDYFLDALARSPHLGALEQLDLSNNQIGDAVQMLLDSPLRERLTRLDLRNNQITSAGALALHAPGSEFLHCRPDLRGNDLGKARPFHKFILGEGTPTRPVNSLGMEFARVPAGTFLMGSPETEAARKTDEGPQRPITLTRPFYLGVYAVTQCEFESVMGVNRSEFTADAGGGPSHPAENVNWEEAIEFCRLLSELPAEREAGRTYRLPTEAEWEHACRAGTTTPFHYGRGLSSHQANMHGGQPYFAPAGPQRRRTLPVGSFAPNAFGLYDMHGNVWEWCADWYSETYLRDAAESDPLGPVDGEMRCQRGGCWEAYGECCRSAYRSSRDPPGRRLNCVGMRVVMDVGGVG
jgi:formylglycine-generating enzyme required for sulfatase activity